MKRKLKLSKETLKTLSPKLLGAVIGGSDASDDFIPPVLSPSDACNDIALLWA